MLNINKLKGKIVEQGMSVADVAEKIGMDRSSLYRKLNSHDSSLLVKEANAIVSVLSISPEEATAIFFSQPVAQGANKQQIGGRGFDSNEPTQQTAARTHAGA
jgi:transcriptional regulator with XRE-family HTH domain